MKTSVISSIIIKVRVRAGGRDLLPQAEATQGEAAKTRKAPIALFPRNPPPPRQTTLVDTVNPPRRSPETPALPHRASKNNCSHFTATHERRLKI